MFKPEDLNVVATSLAAHGYQEISQIYQWMSQTEAYCNCDTPRLLKDAIEIAVIIARSKLNTLFDTAIKLPLRVDEFYDAYQCIELEYQPDTGFIVKTSFGKQLHRLQQQDIEQMSKLLPSGSVTIRQVISALKDCLVFGEKIRWFDIILTDSILTDNILAENTLANNTLAKNIEQLRDVLTTTSKPSSQNLTENS